MGTADSMLRLKQWCTVHRTTSLQYQRNIFLMKSLEIVELCLSNEPTYMIRLSLMGGSPFKLQKDGAGK